MVAPEATQVFHNIGLKCETQQALQLATTAHMPIVSKWCLETIYGNSFLEVQRASHTLAHLAMSWKKVKEFV